MSTRQTLSYNEDPATLSPAAASCVPAESRQWFCPSYHLYLDVTDTTRRVYLELSGPGVSFEAEPGRVVVCIPGPVWDRIVRVGPLGGGGAERVATVEIDS